MKKAMVGLAVLAFAVSVPAVFGAGGNAAAGKTVFMSKCAMCHGPNGEGKEAIAKMFKVKMLPLGSKEIQSKSDAELKKVIENGYEKMKPVKGLSETQVTDVIAFVRTLAEKK